MAGALDNDDPRKPEQHAEQHVATDLRIANLAAQNARPGDDRLRPEFAHVRFQRHVESPDHRGHEEARADREYEHSNRADVRDEVLITSPEQHLQRKYHQPNTKRAVVITFAAAVV